MKYSKLNSIWKELQENATFDTTEKYSIADNNPVQNYDPKTTWACNAACDAGCRWSREDETSSDDENNQEISSDIPKMGF